MPPHKLRVELSYTARHSRPPAAPRQVQTTPRTDGEEAGLPGPEEGLGTAASSVPGRRLPGGLTTGSIPSPHQGWPQQRGPTGARAGRGPDPGHAHPPLGGGSRPHEGANAVRTGTHRHRKECVPWPPRGGVPGQGSQLLAKTVSVCLLQLPRTLKAGELVRKQIPVAHACGGSGPGTDPSATLPGPSRVTTCWRGDPGRKDAWGPRRTTLIPETGPLCHFRNQ